MNEEMQELIQEAKRELRRASGLPLTPEEQAEENRLTQITQLESFIHKILGFTRMLRLGAQVIWSQGGALVEMKVDTTTFHLRKEKDSCRLYIVEQQGERELMKVDSHDPQLSNRIVVAIGDACPNA